MANDHRWPCRCRILGYGGMGSRPYSKSFAQIEWATGTCDQAYGIHFVCEAVADTQGTGVNRSFAPLCKISGEACGGGLYPLANGVQGTPLPSLDPNPRAPSSLPPLLGPNASSSTIQQRTTALLCHLCP